MKITIITPTYNDADTIEDTLDSLFEQTYQNYELIIINDGSTDNTEQIINEYKKKKDKANKIKYIYQENKDQLNAVIKALQYITGDIVFVLHSDDLLPYKKSLEDRIKFFQQSSDCDAITGDLTIINEASIPQKTWKALPYKNRNSLPALLVLNYGANIFGDVATMKTEVYKTTVKNNYLEWNMPFWLDVDNTKRKILNVKTTNFSLLKYRIHEDNYINNPNGQFSVLNGELRTLTRTMKYYDIPLFNLQRGLFLLLRIKGIRKLRLSSSFRPFYFQRESRNKDKLVKKAIVRIYGDTYQDNPYLRGIISFYQNLEQINREIKLEVSMNEIVYKGKDIRLFAKNLFDNKLSVFYQNIFEEMNKGFSTIIVKNKNQKEKMIDIIKFLNIYPYVEIKIRR